VDSEWGAQGNILGNGLKESFHPKTKKPNGFMILNQSEKEWLE